MHLIATKPAALFQGNHDNITYQLMPTYRQQGLMALSPFREIVGRVGCERLEVVTARNELLKRVEDSFGQLGYTHVLFVDSDIGFDKKVNPRE